MKNTFLTSLSLVLSFILILVTQHVILGQPSISSESIGSSSKEYLTYVRNFADNLLQYGRDEYGPRVTPMWASVIDVRDRSVPIRGVPPTQGVRPHDRAVGGSNYYHDVVTCKVFEALSQLTGDATYSKAVQQYSERFLALTQNASTGLLGWGEHLYYNFYTDTVNVAENLIFEPQSYTEMPHELIAWTPPWQRLWQSDSSRTRKAIEGLQYHYNGPDPQVYLFNRHATWNKAEYQNVIMPWIKHSALYSYSFAFMYEKTGKDKWKKLSRDTGLLYWKVRDSETDLVFSNFYHASEVNAGKLPSLKGTALYAYWLYKAWELNGVPEMRKAALSILKSYYHYGWDKEKKGFLYEVNLDGSKPKNVQLVTPWRTGYSSSSTLVLGSVAAYIYANEKDIELKEIAIKAANTTNSFPLPSNFTAQNLGDVINLNMDLYSITKEEKYINEARKYADTALKQLWKNGFFVRHNDDHIYEAKLGTGWLAAGLLRIYLAVTDQKVKMDWSF